jgi:arylsulfatase A-like enzyme
MYSPHYSKEEYKDLFSSYHNYLLEKGFEPDQEKRGRQTFNRVTAANMPEELTKAAFTAEMAAQFIEQKHDSPFMLYVNFLEPHMPYTGPLNDEYSKEDWQPSPTFLAEDLPESSMRNKLLHSYYMNNTSYEGNDLTTKEGWQTLRRNYWGLVTQVDNAVGVIMDALDKSGQKDNTIVVFTSDHGDMMGDHGILAKCVQYEEAIKVPLLIYVPWLLQEKKFIKGRISQVDLVPTLLDLMQQEIPAELDGESRLSVLNGEDSLKENDVFVEWHPEAKGIVLKTKLDLSEEEVDKIRSQPWRTVISHEGWKLNLSPGDQCELFDLNTDPYEQHNLFNKPEYRSTIEDLTSRILAWQKKTGDIEFVLSE